MKNILFLYLLFCFSMNCFSQTDTNQAFQKAMIDLSIKDLENAKSTITNDLLNSSEVSNQILGQSALVYFYTVQKENIYQEASLKALKKAEELYLKDKTDRNKAYLDFGYMLYYQKTKKHDKFVEYFNKSIKLLKQEKDENFLITIIHFSKIEYIEAHFTEKFNKQDLHDALNYAIQSKNIWTQVLAYNNLGNFDFQQANLEAQSFEKLVNSAADYFKKSYDLIPQIKYKPAQTDAYVYYYMNMAGVFAYTNRLDESKKLLLKGVEISEKNPLLLEETIRLYSNLGIVEEMQNNPLQAEKNYLKAYNLLNDTLPTGSKIVISDYLFLFYKKQKNYQKALHYNEEKTKYIIEEYENVNKGLDLFNEVEQKKLILEEKNEALSKQKLLYIVLAIFFLLAVLGLIFVIINRQKISKQNEKLWEEEQRRLKAEKELIEIKKEQLQKKHLATTLQLNHKASVLTEIKEQSNKDRNSPINTLLKEDHLVENDLAEIQETIFDIHPDFFDQLKKQSNNTLSQMELKYAALIYAHMDNRQISNYMKVDVNAVRVTKHRIKKKLNLEKVESLEEYIQKIKLDE